MEISSGCLQKLKLPISPKFCVFLLLGIYGMFGKLKSPDSRFPSHLNLMFSSLVEVSYICWNWIYMGVCKIEIHAPRFPSHLNLVFSYMLDIWDLSGCLQNRNPRSPSHLNWAFSSIKTLCIQPPIAHICKCFGSDRNLSCCSFYKCIFPAHSEKIKSLTLSPDYIELLKPFFKRQRRKKK